MTNIFEHTRASWVHYSDYEWRTAEDGKDYLLPAKDAQPKPYDPMEDADNLVLAAADMGYDTLIMGIRDADAIRRLLDIPENEQIMSVIAVGRREKAPAPRPRKALDEVTRFI